MLSCVRVYTRKKRGISEKLIVTANTLKHNYEGKVKGEIITELELDHFKGFFRRNKATLSYAYKSN